MSNKEGYLDILPANEIRFDLVLNKTLEKSLFLKNNSEYAVAFKVKTTAPKRYCVRPNSSVIKAHESMEVRIVMQPLKELPPEGQPFQDKFLVQACQTDKDTDDAKTIFENKGKDDIIDQKLLCTFNRPGLSTAPQTAAKNSSLGSDALDTSANTSAYNSLNTTENTSLYTSVNTTASSSILETKTKPTALRSSAPPAKVSTLTTQASGGEKDADLLRQEQLLTERLSKELKEARDREVLLQRELVEEREKNQHTRKTVEALEDKYRELQARGKREKAAGASGSTDANKHAPPTSSSAVNNALLFLLIMLVSILLFQQLGNAPSSLSSSRMSVGSLSGAASPAVDAVPRKERDALKQTASPQPVQAAKTEAPANPVKKGKKAKAEGGEVEL